MTPATGTTRNRLVKKPRSGLSSSNRKTAPVAPAMTMSGARHLTLDPIGVAASIEKF